MKLDRETEALLYWTSSATATPLWTLSPQAARNEYRRTLSKTEIAPPAIGEASDLAIPGHEGENTRCYQCGKLIVRRQGYSTRVLGLNGSKCRYCGAELNFRTSSESPAERRSS